MSGDRTHTLWIDIVDLNDAVRIWRKIVASGEPVLDPEMAAHLLCQCRFLAHSRCWLKTEEELTDVIQALSIQFDNRLTEAAKERCNKQLPIPYLLQCTRLEIIATEKDLSHLVDDKSPEAFQRRVSLLLRLTTWYMKHGDILKARQFVSDARRFALGLLNCLSEAQLPSKSFRNFTAEDMWTAQGLYALCLILMAEISMEFEEFTETHFLLEEATKLIRIMGSTSLFCIVEQLSARLNVEQGKLSCARIQMETLTKSMSSEKIEIKSGSHKSQFYTKLLMKSALLHGEILQEMQEPLHALRVLREAQTISQCVYRPCWQFRLVNIVLACQFHRLEGSLTFTRSIALIMDYLNTVGTHEISTIDISDFISLAMDGFDSTLGVVHSDLYLFGSLPLTEQFRASLDLGGTAVQDLSGLKSKMQSLWEHPQPETKPIIDILQFAVDDGLETSDLVKILLLLVAWNACTNVHRLLHRVSSHLGYLLATGGYLPAAAFFFVCSLGNGIRLQLLHNLAKKSSYLSDTEQLRQSLTLQPFDIHTEPRFMDRLNEECRRRLDVFLQVCASEGPLVSLRQLPKALWAQRIVKRLILVRVSRNRCPIVALLPEEFHIPDEASRVVDGAAAGGPLKERPADFSAVLQSLSDILQENRQSFDRDASHEDRKELENWWRSRVLLDQRLKTLLCSVERTLGPWKLLLHGGPLNEVMLHHARQFVNDILSLSDSAIGSQQSMDILVEIVAVLLRGCQHLSDEDVIRTAEFFRRFSCVQGTADQILWFFHSVRSTEKDGTTTPSRICRTAIRKSNRIRRMRSTIKLPPDRALLSASPLPTPLPYPLGDHTSDRSVLPSKETADPFITPQKPLHRLSLLQSEVKTDVMYAERKKEDGRHLSPVMLIMDFQIQHFPWESLPSLRSQSFYRLPNFHIAHYLSSLPFHSTRGDARAHSKLSLSSSVSRRMPRKKSEFCILYPGPRR